MIKKIYVWIITKLFYSDITSRYAILVDYTLRVESSLLKLMDTSKDSIGSTAKCVTPIAREELNKYVGKVAESKKSIVAELVKDYIYWLLIFAVVSTILRYLTGHEQFHTMFIVLAPVILMVVKFIENKIKKIKWRRS